MNANEDTSDHGSSGDVTTEDLYFSLITNIFFTSVLDY